LAFTIDLSLYFLISSCLALCFYIYFNFNFSFNFIFSFNFNFNFSFNYGLTQIGLLIFIEPAFIELTQIETITSYLCDSDSSDCITSGNGSELYGSDCATHGGSESDDCDSCESYSSNTTLVDDEGETSALPIESDS
jgi:hypothetical protein